MGSKTQETTSETETRPSPEAMRHYMDVLDQARLMASTPLAKGAISPFSAPKEVVPAYYVAGQFFGRGGRARYANGGETDAPLNQTKNIKNLKNEVAPLDKQQRKGIKQLGTVQNKQAKKATRQATSLLKKAQLQANQLKTAGQAEYDRAKQLAEQAAQVDAGEIQQYYDPYQQAVIDATMKEANQADSLEQARLRAQAVGRGAFGGGGYDLSRALLGGQQSDARNKTLADLQSAGYSQALGAAQNEANRQAQIAAMYGQLGGQQYGQTLQTGQQYGNLANMQAGLGSTIMDQRLKQAQANIAGGSTLQAQQQAKKNAEYNKRLGQAQYPYNTLSQYGGLAGSLGSLMGGTTSGTQTTSQPSNIFGQILGGLGTLGSFLSAGGRVGYEVGGSVFDPVQPRTSPISGLDMMAADAEGYADGGDVASRIDSMFGVDGPLGGFVIPTSGYDPAMLFDPEVIGQLTAPRPDPSMLAAPTYTDTSVVSGFGEGPFAFRRKEGLVSPEYAEGLPPEPVAGFEMMPLPNPQGAASSPPEITIRKAPALSGAGVAGGGPNPIMAGNRILPFTPEQAAQARSIGSPFEMLGTPETKVASTPEPGLAPMAYSSNAAPSSSSAGRSCRDASPVLPSATAMTPTRSIRIGQMESGLNPSARNPSSSAGGLYQFIDSTWGQYGRGDKLDPAANADAAGRYLADVKSHLQGVLGRDPTPGELYLGHQQGAGGAAKLLTNPNARAADLVGMDAVRLNGGNPNMTAGEFASLWDRKLGGAGGSGATRQRWTQRALASSAAPEPTAGLQVASSQPMIDDAEPVQAPPIAGFAAPAQPQRPRSISERFSEDSWRMPLLVAGLSMLGGGDPGQAIAAGTQAFMAGSQARDEREAEIERANVVRRWAASQGLDANTAELMVQNKDIVEAYAKDKLIPKEPDKGEITEIGGRKYRIMADNTMVDLGPASAPVEPLPPAVEEQKIRMAQASRPETNISVGAEEKSFNKKGGELRAKRFDDIITSAGQASEMIGNIESLRDMGEGIETGKVAEFKAAIGPYAQALGVDIEGLGPMQAYEAVVTRIAPSLRTPGVGAMSDFELRQFLKALPSLGKTPEGNELLTNTLESVAQHRIAAADIASAALSGDIDPDEAERQIRALPDPWTLWKQNKKRFPAVDLAIPEGGDGVTTITSDADFDALPSGAEFIGPDGVKRRKP